jgi:hypothetical protein
MTTQRNNTLKNLPDLGVSVSPVMIRNGKISHGALRLWLLMRSMSTEWHPTIGGFATLMKDRGLRASQKSASRWCRELKGQGYLTITRVLDARKRWVGWAWATYPVPVGEYVKLVGEHMTALITPQNVLAGQSDPL